MDAIAKLNDELELMCHRRQESNLLYMSREADMVIHNLINSDEDIVRQIIATNPRKHK
jgi:hypothetical protein